VDIYGRVQQQQQQQKQQQQQQQKHPPVGGFGRALSDGWPTASQRVILALDTAARVALSTQALEYE
jgi:hypothetical protein